MAEGGTRQRSFKDSFGKASGDADEAFCDPCKSEGKWVAVEGYCQVCDEFMCDTCLAVHKKQKLSKGHVILDKACMPTRLESHITKDICVDVCKTHRPEIIKYYCKAHEVPGCADCMTLYHQNCERERIPDISGGYEKTQEFKHIDEKLPQLYRELKNLRDALNSNLKNLDKTYDDILKNIKAARKQVNDYLDQVEKQVADKAAQLKKEDTIELNKILTECKTMQSEVENLFDSMHESNVNINTLFISTKQAKLRLATMEGEINQIKQQQQQQQQYEFEMSDEIKRIVLAKNPLGELFRKSTGVSQAATTNPIYRATKSENNTASKHLAKTETTNRNSRGQSTSTPLTKVTTMYNCSINVKDKEDKTQCGIYDCAVFNTDRLVVTDWNNHKVKLINTSNNTLITSFGTSNRPYRVTALRTDMVAVTVPEERKILQLKVTSSTITKHAEMKVSGACYGIAHKDGKIAVSYSGRVEILNRQGKTLHEINPQESRDSLKSPDNILFGRNKDTVIVSDSSTNKVSEITFSGQILHTYIHDELKIPRGIVMTEDGLLCVCCWMNDCIHVVSGDFKSSKIIIKHDQHVVRPQSITYCDNKHRLYISDSEGFKLGDVLFQIQVYDLNV